MNRFTKLIAASALALGLGAVAAPSFASTIIFADFDTGASNTKNFRFVGSGDDASVYTTATATGVVAAETAVNFSFLGDPATSDFFDLSSKFFFSGSVTDTAASFDGATYTQTGISGSFYFKYAGPTTTLNAFTVHTGDVLFSGTFNNAWIQGSGGVGGIDVSINNGGSAVFSSAYYDLSRFNPGTEEYTFHLGAVTPAFGAVDPSTGCVPNVGCSHNGTTSLNSFRSHAAGEFQGTVPEPTTWALMILGFGGAGAMIRRRKVAVA